MFVAAATGAPPRDEPPEKLFGISLGEAHTLEEWESGTQSVPVGRAIGFQRIVGEGLIFSFQPVSEYSEFEYQEFPERARTTFWLYLLPVVAQDGSLSVGATTQWQACSIHWSGRADTERWRRKNESDEIRPYE